jgi:hypothetical protein
MLQETAAGPPSFLKKGPSERTPEETMRLYIFQLRDLSAFQWSEPGWPQIFGSAGANTTPASQLVALGPKAIPFLVEALGDATPTRTMVHNRFKQDGDTLLRRQDIAFECLDRILGFWLYRPHGVLTFCQEAAENQAAVLALARAYWTRSRNASQAQMARNYLILLEQGPASEDSGKINPVSPQLRALRTLGNLEGPEAVLDRLLKTEEERWFDEPTLLEIFNPPSRLSDEQITQCVAALETTSHVRRRQAVATYGQDRSYKIQRALLRALELEPDAGERLHILRALNTHPALWHLPELTRVFDQDRGGACRVEAAKAIQIMMFSEVGKPWASDGWVRLETRDAALAVARKVLQDQEAPLSVRRSALDILEAWRAPEDRPLVTKYQRLPAFWFR